MRRLLTLALILGLTSFALAKTTTWTGQAAEDNDWTDASNWDNGVPADNDVVVFDGIGDYADQDVTQNISIANSNGARLEVHSTYSGSIGSSGAYLIHSWDRIVFAGTGDCFFDSGATDDNDIIIVTGTGTSGTLHLKGDIDKLYAYLGDIEYHHVTSYNINECYLQPSSTGATDLTLTVDGASGTSITSTHAWGGTHTVEDSVTIGTLWLHGGTWTQGDSSTISYLYQMAGTFYVSTTGTITQLNVFGGTLDCRNDMNTKTISSLVVYYDGAVYLNNGANNITISNLDVFGFTSPIFDYVSDIAPTYP